MGIMVPASIMPLPQMMGLPLSFLPWILPTAQLASTPFLVSASILSITQLTGTPLPFLPWALMVAQLASTLFLVCATFLTLGQLFETPQLMLLSPLLVHGLFLPALLELVILRLRPPLEPTRWIALYRLFVDF